MEIELTRREVVTKITRDTRKFVIYDGMEIFYYGNNYGWQDNPKEGVIKKRENIFVIEWNDGQDFTSINESTQSKNVLKYCGF